MRAPFPGKGFVLPDLFNLGVAPPHPKDGTRWAQRVRLAPPTAMGDIPHMWTATGPLLLVSFYVPPVGYQGEVLQLPYQAGQLPNPYAPPQW